MYYRIVLVLVILITLYNIKQTPNMGILQFQNVKPKQDLNKIVFSLDIIQLDILLNNHLLELC